MSSSGIHKRLIAVSAVIAGLLIAAASPAFAHDELLGTDPAADAVVQALPDAITLTFSGVLLTGDGATEVVVTDAGGTDLADGEPVVDGVRVTQALTGSASGAVRVAWRVVSSDAHPISGEYTFTVGDGTGTFTPLPGPPMEGTDATGWLWAGAVAALLVLGILIVVLTRRRTSREH